MGRPISNEALLLEIEKKREQMIQSGLENGLRSHKTLELSIQVDNLMNAFNQSRSAHLFLNIK
ncbi:aspartyl-phosphate phosphatase Spo0E family protein [Solibacillus sp. FSL R5-0449]|uniref:aspartyl-phosphate phosphatase Spo0E family protein n=1 Tax=Solibacillus sp. FSL R5-0449 TaxID=2921639 RepID=UPI0030CE1638